MRARFLVNPFRPLDPGTAPALEVRTSSPCRGTEHQQAMLVGALVVAGLMCLVPFLVPAKTLPIPSFYAELASAVLGLLALTALVAWAGRLDVPRVTWLPLAFALLLLLQVGLSLPAYPQLALLAAAYLIWAAALILLGGLLKQELGLDRVVRWLAWFVVAGAAASAVIGVMQYIDSYAFLGRWVTPPSGQRVWANLAQANHLADYLTLGLVSAGYLYATGRLRLVYASASALLMVYVLALTGARAPWLYLAALVALSLAFRAGKQDAASRRLLLYSLALLAVFVALPFGTDWVLPSRLTQPQWAADVRLRLAQAAWLMFRDNPLLGVGFRQFGIQHFLLNADLGAPRVLGFSDHAHNLVLQVMAEFGILGLAVLLAGSLPWLVGLLRQPRAPALWWIAGVTAVIGIHSLLEYPLWYTFFLGPTALVLGLGEPRRLSLHRNNGRSAGLRLALGGMLAFGWLVVFQLTRDFVLLENFLAFRFRYLHASVEVAERSKAMLGEIGGGSLLAPYVDLGLTRTMHLDAEEVAEKLSVSGRAMQAFPIDDIVYRQAMLLALSGDAAGAQRQWERAAASFPGFESTALLVLRRRIEDGISGLRPLASELERKE